MKSKRFTEEQIVAYLKQVVAGVPAKELSRQHDFTEQTFYRWKRQSAGMGIAEVSEPETNLQSR